MTDPLRRALLYHFCRMQMPATALSLEAFDRHLERTSALYRAKEPASTFAGFLDSLYALDWYLCMACLERHRQAWDALFAARTGRSAAGSAAAG